MPEDAIVVGAGPNGLAAAITLARAGISVRLLEAESQIGGGARTAELTLPGFRHDICSAIHPFGYASPAFRAMPLREHGLRWIHAPSQMAHPLDDGSAPTLEISVEDTARQLGEDADEYAAIFDPAAKLLSGFLQAGVKGVLPNALSASRLGLLGLRSGKALAGKFKTERARALLAGSIAHSVLPFNKTPSAGVAMALSAAGHVGGWPFPEGGSQSLANALASYFKSLGGKIETGTRVRDFRELPQAKAVLFDVTPRQLLAIAGDQLPRMYSQVLRNYRYSVGAFKMDWALSDSVPWRNERVRRAATIHIGGGYEEIANSERETWYGRVSERPFIIAAQHSLFDPTRAPAGKHTLWAYCHVPYGSTIDMTERIEAQIERFAPGFRDTILARSVLSPAQLHAHNENLMGGEFVGGAQDIWQLLIRPSIRYWTTPLPNVFLCSSSTPPGAGVHGMCGYLAASVALKRQFGIPFKQLFSLGG